MEPNSFLGIFTIIRICLQRKPIVGHKLVEGLLKLIPDEREG